MQNIKCSNLNPLINHFNDLDYPILLMSFPFHISNLQANNPLMENSHSQTFNLQTAYQQFLKLYQLLSNHALIYILPSGTNHQDLTYVANLGLKAPHHLLKHTVILSNFRSQPRSGEEMIGSQFFSLMGFDILRCPYFFEGEADVKYLKDNIAIGGYGMRTDIKAHRWIEEKMNLKILSIQLNNPYFYHLDCCAFIINQENILLRCKDIPKNELKELEKHVLITDISEDDDALAGSASCLKIGYQIYNASNIHDLSKHDKNYNKEKKRIEKLDLIFSKFKFHLELINLDEFKKSGAGLACFVMHLN